MGWIGSFRCKKFRRVFVAWTFVVVRPVLQLVSLDNQTVLDAPKWYEMHQNFSLGTNGVDRVRSLQKILTRLRATNICTSSTRFAPTFVSQPNGPKCTKIVWNAPKHEFRVQWGEMGTLVEKNSNTASWHELLHQFGPFCTEYCKSTKQSPMHQNCMKGTKIWV